MSGLIGRLWGSLAPVERASLPVGARMTWEGETVTKRNDGRWVGIEVYTTVASGNEITFVPVVGACDACPHNHPSQGRHLCRAPFSPATREWSAANTDKRGKVKAGASGCPGFGGVL